MAAIVFVSIAIVCALILHWRVRSFFLASIISGPVASLIFQGVITVQLGYMDPFALIAVVVGAFYAWLIAIMVGLPFLGVRSKRRGSDHQASE